jgi:hypothetical protein
MNEPARRPAESSRDRVPGLERAAYVSLLAFAAAPQFSIAASGILLGLSALLWIAVVVVNRERVEVPRMFWPLAAYAAATLVAALFSVDPRISLADCKQLLLFAIVPMSYRLFRGERSLTVSTSSSPSARSMRCTASSSTASSTSTTSRGACRATSDTI